LRRKSSLITAILPQRKNTKLAQAVGSCGQQIDHFLTTDFRPQNQPNIQTGKNPIHIPGSLRIHFQQVHPMLLRKKANQCGLPNLTRTSKIPEASGNSRNANALTNLIVFASLTKFTYRFSVY
jgi:hypothetical protein